jgi:ribonuclease BN (tRNA processing enzyme)
MNLSNREELIAAMQQAMQPNPQQQQMAQAAQQAQLEFQQSQTAALAAQAQESQARATKLAAEAQAVPQELEIDRINAVTRNLREGDAEDKEFERRMKVADTLLKEKQIEGKTNVNNAKRNAVPSGPSQQPLPRNIPTANRPRRANEPTGSQGGGIM